MTNLLKSEFSKSQYSQELHRRIVALEKELETKEEENKKLRGSLFRYELAASGSNDGFWDWDLLTGEFFVSEPWKKMLGYKDFEAANGISVLEDLLHPEDKERTFAAIHDYINGKSESYAEQFRMRHKDGHYKWIQSKAAVLRDISGKAFRISGSHADISQRKFAEEALVQSEKKFRNLFENSFLGMFRTDAKTGEILEANGKFWELLDVAPAKGINTSQFYLKPTDRARVLAPLFENKNVENVELQLKKGDGSLFWVSFSGVFYEEDQMIECVIVEITKTKENLLELQRLNFELDNFVYHASHDLRSPLRSVLGLVELIRLNPDKDTITSCIEMIESSVNRLDHFVVDLLSLSRNNRVDDPHVAINFLIEINNCLSSFHNIADTKNLEVISKIHQPNLFLSDVTRLRIILNNLISNAIKYRSYNKPQSFIHIDVTVDTKSAVITIKDNGEGIPEDKIGSVFDMFVRASESSEGSGLGLYIVKNVVEKMNGTITLESTYQVGTTFTLEIPNAYYTPEEITA